MRRLSYILVGALLSAAPDVTHAQILKRIGRAAVEKAAGSAVDRTVGRDSSANPAAATSTNDVAKVARPAKVEITTASLDALVAGMQPVLAVLQQRQAYAASMRKRDAYRACRTRFAGQPGPQPSSATAAEIERMSEASKSLVEQLLAASSARDTATVRRLNDSSEALMDRQQALLNPAFRAQCGARPERVAEPPRTALDTAVAQARVASGMTSTQMGRMRERVGLYLLAPSAPNDLGDAERAAVEARRTALAPLVALMRDGTMTWTSWHDLQRGGWDGGA